MVRAIDVHVHPSTPEYVDDVLGVLFAWDAETHSGLPPVTNDFVAGCARAHPDAFIGFASVDPGKGEAAVLELERAVRDLGLRGLKLHPTAQGFRPDDRAVYPIFETAAALGIPVTVHTGTTGLGAGMPGGGNLELELSRPIYLDTVAANFPNLQIVMAHPAWPWQDEQLAVALHKPNTWIDLSGWSPRRFSPDLVRNIKGQLQDRVLFGTDYPFLTHEQWFGAWDTLEVPEPVTQKVLLENAQRLLGL